MTNLTLCWMFPRQGLCVNARGGILAWNSSCSCFDAPGEISILTCTDSAAVLEPLPPSCHLSAGSVGCFWKQASGDHTGRAGIKENMSDKHSTTTQRCSLSSASTRRGEGVRSIHKQLWSQKGAAAELSLSPGQIMTMQWWIQAANSLPPQRVKTCIPLWSTVKNGSGRSVLDTGVSKCQRKAERRGEKRGESLVQDDSIPSYCSSSWPSSFHSRSVKKWLKTQTSPPKELLTHKECPNEREGLKHQRRSLKTMSEILQRGRRRRRGPGLTFSRQRNLRWWETEIMSNSSLRLHFVF